MATTNDSAREFAERLCILMKAKGHTSDRSRSGVDVTALAKAAGVTYEMARRSIGPAFSQTIFYFWLHLVVTCNSFNGAGKVAGDKRKAA